MRGHAIKLFLVGPNTEFLNLVVDLLAKVEDVETLGGAVERDQALSKIGEILPNLVLVDGAFPDAFSLCEEITQKHLNTAVIMASDPPLEDILKKALQAGARDVLKKPVDAVALVESIYAAFEYQNKRKPFLPPAGVEDLSGRGTKVITVFSTKGGTGKSTIAINLAVTLAKMRNKTVLWDLDLHHGIAAVALNLIQKRHLADMLNEIRYLDEDLLQSYFEKHESGLMLLPAPFTPEFADFVTPDHVKRILALARDRWDYVIVDTPSIFCDPVVTAMRLSDLILLVGSLDLGTIKNLKACLMVMEKLNFYKANVRLVVNRIGKDFGVRLKDIEETLKMPAFATVPSDAKSVITGLNQGVPAAYAMPNSAFGRSIHSLARSIMNMDRGSAGTRRSEKVHAVSR